jgi:hypothetical protein
MRRVFIIQILLFSFLIINLLSVGHAEHVSLPEDLTVARPSSDISKEIASFSGARVGDSWDGILPHVLVVERVENNGTLSVINAIGIKGGK